MLGEVEVHQAYSPSEEGEDYNGDHRTPSRCFQGIAPSRADETAPKECRKEYAEAVGIKG